MTSIDWCQRAADTKFCVQNFINGHYINGSNDITIDKVSPRDGSLLYQFSAGTPEDMAEGIKYARQAYQDKRWRGLSIYQRKTVLLTLANLVEVHQETFALYESLDAGKPITAAIEEVMHASEMLREAAEGADKLFSPYLADGTYCAYQLRKPVGVVGAIVSWNYPLIVAALKVGPALIMGNSLVLKPSELTSLSASFLAALALEAGVPPGVFNVVNGAGNIVGSTLAHHMDVDLLSFTGSSAIGKQMQIAAGKSNMKRLLLECGGKAPYLVFDDCPDNLDVIATDIVAMAFNNNGANCLANTRLLVQAGIKDTLLSKVIEQATLLVPQDPLNQNTKFGALISEAHMNKVLDYIDNGEQQGAKLIQGGKRVHVDTSYFGSKGFYIEPTIFDQVNPRQEIACDEIFGPVLSVLSFDDEKEAIELANKVRFGLAAYVATENMCRAHRLCQSINAGLVMVTGTSEPSESYNEIGKEGFLESGFGLEGGLLGLASYSVSTAVHQWM